MTLTIKQSLDEEDDDDDDDEDEVYGVTSAFDLHNNTEVAKQILAYLETNSKDSKNEDIIKVINDSNNKVALIVSERYVNLPPALSVPAFENLVKELQNSRTVQFSHFVIISKILRPKSKKSKKKVKGVIIQPVDIIYSNGEEELFDEKATHSFEFSVAHQCDENIRDGNWDDDDTEYTPLRKVMLLERETFFDVVTRLKDVV